jgi:hypothetical protein
MLSMPLINDVTTSSPIAPVYTFLKQAPFDGEIPWNYTKFLVGRDGQGLSDVIRHVIGCRSRRNEGLNCVLLTWRATRNIGHSGNGIGRHGLP